jgi:hypothetical protein
MGRLTAEPQNFGVMMRREQFTDVLVDEYNEKFRGQLTVDELLLHPRDALRFCDDVRQKHGWYDVPDDIILRSMLHRRRHPTE